MKQFAKKVKVDGYTFDSAKEAQFYQQFIKPSGYKYEVHPSYTLTNSFLLGGYRQRKTTYAPDFVVFDEGEIKHVYDVKTSLSSEAISSGAKVRFKWFQLKYRIPVEIVVPRAHDFKMVLYGFTTPHMLDGHAHHDKHGNIKYTKNGDIVYDYYEVYKSIDYDIRDIVGW